MKRFLLLCLISTASAQTTYEFTTIPPTITTNTVLGNGTSATAAPQQLPMTSCSTSASAVKWTTNTGFGCNTAIDAATLLTGTWAAPGSIGSGTPAAGAFTTLSTSGLFSPNSIAVASSTGTNMPVNLFSWGIPVGIPPSGSFPDAAGTYVIGQAPSSSATCVLDRIANGAGAHIDCSAATLLNTAADVGRVFTINDSGTYRYFTITANASTTIATGTISNGSFTGTAATISGVAITGTAGQFSCTCTGFVVGLGLTLSGTYGGTGSITGYANPTTYFVSATNGTSTFTLQSAPGSAIVTTAGTPTGITYTPIGTASIANNKIYLSGTPTANTTAFSVPLLNAYTSSYMYFGANVICASGSGPCSSGNSAGLYYAACSTTTLCQVYTNTLASGKPTIPVTVAFSGGNSPGAFTQGGSFQTLLTLSIPANSLGTQGALVTEIFGVRPSNADTIVMNETYGGATIGQVSAATVLWYPMWRTMRNTGATNAQIAAGTLNTGSDLSTANTAPVYSAVDTTSSQNLLIRGQLTTSGVDSVFVVGGTVIANYSP